MVSRENALKAATTLLNYIGSLDPQFFVRMNITRSEWRLDDLQVAGSYIAYVLENDLHTVISRHPFFLPEHAGPEQEISCPVCHKVFRPAYPGQPVCSNECSVSFYAK